MPSPVKYVLHGSVMCTYEIVIYGMHDCVLDLYHVSPEGFDGHYEHKKDHKCIEDSLETLWYLSTHYGTSVS